MEVLTMKRVRAFYFVLATVALFILPSCGGGGDGGGAATQTGSLSVALTDASTDKYQAVYVTISEVQVHVTADSWKVVASPNKTYNLLDLVNGVREELGIAELDAGNYTEMRLILGETPDEGINILSQQHPYANYAIDLKDNEHELKVPSGYQTGIKIVKGFTINANQTTELILDFDASASVVVAGKSGKWLLKPTIKVLRTEEWAIISGTVTDSEGPLEGVLVSAQISNSSQTALEDQVVIQASTVTDVNGQYKIFIEPIDYPYTLVAYIEGYDPGVDCSVSLSQGEEAGGHNFTLGKALATGTVYGPVTITGADPDQYATISFRQTVDCEGIEKEFEVKSINVSNTADYEIILPVGFYDVVVSTYGKTSIIYKDVEIKADEFHNLAITIEETEV
jgi:hypothetical protein